MSTTEELLGRNSNCSDPGNLESIITNLNSKIIKPRHELQDMKRRGVRLLGLFSKIISKFRILWRAMNSAGK
jgi:hypothetical protein